MPYRAQSTAIVRAIPAMPDFDAVYAARRGSPTMLSTDPMNTTEPGLSAAMSRRAKACAAAKPPVRLVAMMASQVSSSIFSAEVNDGLMPALYTRASTLPRWASNSSTTSRIRARSATSRACPLTGCPCASASSSATPETCSALRPVTPTSAPISAKRSAIARPIPRVPPTTSTAFPRTSATPIFSPFRLLAWTALADAPVVSLPLLLAQHELLHLAGGGLRQLPELHRCRALEARQAFPAEFDDLLLGDALPRLELDERLGSLAPLLVGYRDDGGLQHGRVVVHRLLDLDGRDVLAAGDDDVLFAVAQLHVTVRVPGGDVAGVVPAALECLGGDVGLLEVALHHGVAARHELPEGLGVAGDVVHVVVHDPREVGYRVGLSLAGELAGLVFDGKVVPLLVPAAHRAWAVSLGRPVEVDRAYVQVLELREKLRRRRRAPDGGGDLPVDPARLLVVDEPDLDGRRRAVVGHPLGLDEVPDPGGVHLAQAHVRPRNRRDAPGKAPAVAVEHRQDPEIHRTLVHLRRQRDAQGVQISAPVAVHRPLGFPGRPRRVVYADCLFFVLEHAGQGFGRAVGKVVLVRVAGFPGVVYADDL